MAGQSRRKDEFPNIAKTFAAIQREGKKYTDRKAQADFLRTLLTPKQTAGLDKSQIIDKGFEFRDKISTAVRDHRPWHHEGHAHARKSCSYTVMDTFALGPERTISRDYLDRIGYDWEDSTDSGSDESDIDSVEELREPIRRRDLRPVEPHPTAEETSNRSVPSQSAQTESNEHMDHDCASTGPDPGSGEGANVGVEWTVGTAVGTPDSSKIVKRTRDDIETQSEPGPGQSSTSIHEKQKQRLEERVIHVHPRSMKWCRDAGLLEMPNLPPTKQPRNPTEIVTAGDQVWLTSRLEKLEKALWDTTMAYLQENTVDAAAPTYFVPMPRPELASLYKGLCGSDRWQVWVYAQQKWEGVAALRQDYTLMGLLARAIRQNILMAKPKWDLQGAIETSLGDDVKYLRDVVDDLGHDLDAVLKHAAGKQIADPDFLANKVAQHARDEAGALILTLQPHLRQMIKRDASPPAIKYRPWIDLLESAFREAIQVRYTLRVSPLGPFAMVWPKAGSAFDGTKHRAMFESDKSGCVLHTIIPAFRRGLEDETIVFSRALVIPTSPSVRF